MGRCGYCNEKIEAGQEYILEGQYPGYRKKMRDWTTGYSFLIPIPDILGTMYHRGCFLEMLRGGTPDPEAMVREEKIRKMRALQDRFY